MTPFDSLLFAGCQHSNALLNSLFLSLSPTSHSELSERQPPPKFEQPLAPSPNNKERIVHRANIQYGNLCNSTFFHDFCEAAHRAHRLKLSWSRTSIRPIGTRNGSHQPFAARFQKRNRKSDFCQFGHAAASPSNWLNTANLLPELASISTEQVSSLKYLPV